MSKARRRESSADNGISVAEAGSVMESGSDNDKRSPSQNQKPRLMENGDIE